MADKDLPGLTAGSTPLDGTELHYIVQGGNSRKVAGSEIVKIAHSQPFSSITSTPTTISGYGITDAASSAQGALADTALQPGAIGDTVQAHGATLDSLESLSLVAGDILYATGSDALARLAKGSDGEVLKLASGIPSWGTAAGAGDMLASIYDPNAVGADAFDMASMVEATDAKIMTADERAAIASAVQPADLGNSAALDVGTTAGTVAAGDDSRLSDERTPLDDSVTNAKVAMPATPADGIIAAKILAGPLPFTGYAAQSLLSKLGELVSIKDFGAVGDGNTDDTSAVSAAIAANVPLYVPPGFYVITNAITDYVNPHTLIGSGLNSTFIMATPEASFQFSNRGNTISSVSFLPRNTGINAATALVMGEPNTDVGNSGSNLVFNCTFGDGIGAFAKSIQWNGVWYSSILSNFFHGPLDKTNTHIEGNHSVNNSVNGNLVTSGTFIHLTDTEGPVIDMNEGWFTGNNVAAGIQTFLKADSGVHISVVNNGIDLTRNIAISSKADSTIISNNWIALDGATVAVCIDLYGTLNVVSGNTITGDLSGAAVLVAIQEGADNTVITGNQAMRAGFEAVHCFGVVANVNVTNNCMQNQAVRSASMFSSTGSVFTGNMLTASAVPILAGDTRNDLS